MHVAEMVIDKIFAVRSTERESPVLLTCSIGSEACHWKSWFHRRRDVLGKISNSVVFSENTDARSK